MMQAAVLDRPQTTNENVSFCHIVCLCTPKLTLCGAYKERPCGVMYMDARGNCPVCEKALCADCGELVEQACLRCGL
jgi:hypothetical protein